MQTIVNSIVNSWKTEEAATSAMVAFGPDEDFETEIAQRKDGRYIVIVRDKETKEFISCL